MFKWLRKHLKKIIALVAIALVCIFCWYAIAAWGVVGGTTLPAWLPVIGGTAASAGQCVAYAALTLAAGGALARDEIKPYIDKATKTVGDAGGAVAEAAGNILDKGVQAAGKVLNSGFRSVFTNPWLLGGVCVLGYIILSRPSGQEVKVYRNSDTPKDGNLDNSKTTEFNDENVENDMNIEGD